MKNNLKRVLILSAFCIIGLTNQLFAQSVYQINDSKDNKMKLSGTSTLHDWNMIAKTFTGEAQFDFNTGPDKQLVTLHSLNFSLIVLNLKSDKKALDKNAYRALKSNQYKSILYSLVSAKVSSGKDDKFLLKTQGNLTIAGVTREVTMDVYCLVNKDGTITCSGSYKLNMTDYKVKPPTFMLGAMKTGEALTLDFIMVYKKQIGV